MLSYRFTDEEKISFKWWRFLRILEDVFLDQAETGDLLLCSNKKKFSMKSMKTPSHVDRVFVIFKLEEANDQVIVSEHDKIHILRICAKRKGIILEKWSDFKVYCQDKFTDIIYRSLNMERDADFLSSARQYVEALIKDPFVTFQATVTKHTDQGPVQEQVEQKRSYRNAEIAYNFYTLVNVLYSQEELSMQRD